MLTECRLRAKSRAPGRRSVILGAVYAALERLERNGLVSSRMGNPSPERGGRAKRFFDVTPQGLRAVKETQRSLVALWKGVAATEGRDGMTGPTPPRFARTPSGSAGPRQRAARRRLARRIPAAPVEALAVASADLSALVMQALYAPHPPVSLNLTPVDPVVAEWLMSKRLYKKEDGESHRQRRRRHRRPDDGHPGLHDGDGHPRHLVVRRWRHLRGDSAGNGDGQVTEICASQHGDTEARSFKALSSMPLRAHRSFCVLRRLPAPAR